MKLFSINTALIAAIVGFASGASADIIGSTSVPLGTPSTITVTGMPGAGFNYTSDFTSNVEGVTNATQSATMTSVINLDDFGFCDPGVECPEGASLDANINAFQGLTAGGMFESSLTGEPVGMSDVGRVDAVGILSIDTGNRLSTATATATGIFANQGEVTATGGETSTLMTTYGDASVNAGVVTNGTVCPFCDDISGGGSAHINSGLSSVTTMSGDGPATFSGFFQNTAVGQTNSGLVVTTED